MRIRTTLLTGALLLASTFAMAQQPAQTTDKIPETPGQFDYGFRLSSVDGDAARFGRFQDVRRGQADVNFKWNREDKNWFLNIGGNHLGYSDQLFSGVFGSNKLKASFEWNQTPLYYGSSDVLKTPYTTAISGGVATMALDGATRSAVQTSGAIGIPQSAAQMATGSIYQNLQKGIDVRSGRNEAKLDLVYQASRDVDVKFTLNNYSRKGTQPWGAAFAFNDAVELPLPIDNRTTDFKTEVEWANQQGMFRFGYDGSYFNNDVTTLVWNNPMRYTDAWNASSYSNAALGGSTWGRMALAPNNHANTVSATGMYKLPGRSSFNASLAVSSLSQNDALIPFTINPTLQPGTSVTVANVGTWTTVAPERATAEANVRLTVANVNFTTRPNRYFGLTAKYRRSSWDNRTPIFENQYNVRFDGAPENVPGSETEPADISHNTFDADASFTPVAYAAFRVGYGHDSATRTYRMFEGAKENTFRVSFDTIGNQFVTMRAKYEISKREGEGLLDGTGGTENYFTEVGQQPAMRQFDVANRDRKRATIVFDASPVPVLGLSMSIFRGTDEYPDQTFGLLNNENTGLGFDVQIMPNDKVTFGVNYGYEKYSALQASRTANPAPDVTWTDATRDWNLNNTERVDNWGVSLDLTKAIAKTEIRFGYDYSKSDQGFIYGGPRIDAIKATNSFIPLPNVGNKLQTASVDFKYFITPKIALGLNFLHQKFDVSDWQTPGTLFTDTYSPVGGLILGYAMRPYNANVGGFRMIYLF